MAVERRRDRLDFFGTACLLPEVPHLGWTHLRQASDAALAPHAHAGWEICWVRRGGVDWWAGDETWHVGQGDCYVTRPGEEHGGVHTVLERCELFWLQLVPVGRSLPGMEAADAQSVLKRLATLPARVFAAAGDGLNQLWWELLAAHRDAPPLARLRARAALHGVLATVLDAAERHQSMREPSAPIRAAMAHVRARLDRDCPVAELARVARLSPSRFHDRFVTEVGETPADWTRQQRIVVAKGRLADGDAPITSLALDLGFPSSQYFATVFRRYAGVTPREFRRRAQRALAR